MSTDLHRALLHSLEAEIAAAVALREFLHANSEPSHGEGGNTGLVAGVGGHGAFPHLARDPIKPAHDVRDIPVPQLRQEDYAY